MSLIRRIKRINLYRRMRAMEKIVAVLESDRIQQLFEAEMEAKRVASEKKHKEQMRLVNLEKAVADLARRYNSETLLKS